MTLSLTDCENANTNPADKTTTTTTTTAMKTKDGGEEAKVPGERERSSDNQDSCRRKTKPNESLDDDEDDADSADIHLAGDGTTLSTDESDRDVSTPSLPQTTQTTPDENANSKH